MDKSKVSSQPPKSAPPKIVEFYPSPGHTVSPTKAKIYGRELVRIERVCGNLENRTIWQAAKASSSPLHEAFEWDDAVAADKFRDEQARKLKQGIEVEIRFADGRTARGPLTIALQQEEIEVQHGNRTPVRVETLVRVLGDEGKVERMVKEALEQLEDWRDRYRCLEHLSDVWSAVDDALRRRGSGKQGATS